MQEVGGAAAINDHLHNSLSRSPQPLGKGYRLSTVRLEHEARFYNLITQALAMA